MHSTFRSVALAVAVLLIAASPAHAQSSGTAGAPASPGTAAPSGQATGINPMTTVVAKVGDEEIYLHEILQRAQALPEQYRQATLADLYPALLDMAINQRVAARAGRLAGYAEKDEVRIRVRSAETEIITEVYLRDRVLEHATEDALRAEYEARRATLGDEEKVRARHILLETEEEARDVITNLDQGAVFADLARDRSTGPSGAQGGDLGWFTRGNMVPEFSDAAFSLSPGEYTTEPVRTDFGWHVILLEERQEGRVPEFEEARQELERIVAKAALDRILADLMSKTTVERFNVDGTPLSEPGGN